MAKLAITESARKMLRKFIHAGAVVAMLTGTASAQMPALSPFAEQPARKKTPEEIEKQKALDRAYKSATDKIPDKRTGDPWSNVRPVSPTTPQNPSPSQKSTSSQTKQQ